MNEKINFTFRRMTQKELLLGDTSCNLSNYRIRLHCTKCSTALLASTLIMTR